LATRHFDIINRVKLRDHREPGICGTIAAP
jgi:hypothetical protein